jgi:hypothetical protein
VKIAAGVGVELRQIYLPGRCSHHPNNAPQQTNPNPNSLSSWLCSTNMATPYLQLVLSIPVAEPEVGTVNTSMHGWICVGGFRSFLGSDTIAITLQYLHHIHGKRFGIFYCKEQVQPSKKKYARFDEIGLRPAILI